MEEYNNLDTDQISIVDGIIDWLRVVHKDNIDLYANKKMQHEL